jgi:HK97 family phage major capsid protein
MELKESIDELNQNFSEFQKKNKEATEQAIKGYVDPLLKAQVDRLNDAITKAEDAKEAAEKAQSIAQAHRSIEKSVENDRSKESIEYRGAFVKWVAGGENNLSESEKNVLQNPSAKLFGKSLASASDPNGGYFVMPEMDSEITKVLNETSPIRSVARLVTIGSDQYEKMQTTDLPVARWADRDEAPTQTNTQTYKKLSIKAWKIEAEPRISQDLLDDSFINIEQELMTGLTEAISILENTAFVVGDGVGQPRGLLDYPSGTSWNQIEQINSGHATLLTYEGIINLVYGLKDGYLQRAKFVMKRSTVAALRKLVDGNGNSLWQPGFGSEPATVMGYPIVRANDMPAVTTDTLSIAFGDFSRGYIIVDRLGTRVLRDPYTAKPFVKFYTTKRVGGGVDNYEAIKIQKTHVV